MEENDEPAKPVFRKGTLVAEGGQPLRSTDVVEVANPTPNSSLSHAVAETLKTYRKAALALLDGKYASVRNLAPPHLRLPCHILVLCCPDGVLVRYDLAGEEKPKAMTTCSWRSKRRTGDCFGKMGTRDTSLNTQFRKLGIGFDTSRTISERLKKSRV